jgi:hypothetical protein
MRPLGGRQARLRPNSDRGRRRGRSGWAGEVQQVAWEPLGAGIRVEGRPAMAVEGTPRRLPLERLLRRGAGAVSVRGGR